MCDFLVYFGTRHSGDDLLELLKKIYIAKAPPGKVFTFKWGSAAILSELFTGSNMISRGDSTLAWVGDLITPFTELSALADFLNFSLGSGLSDPEPFRILNGAYAVCFLNPLGCAAITDPLGLTQVYAGYDSDQKLAAIGTHSDLVATVSRPELNLDNVSIAEYLNRGSACFPHTMHKHVRKIFPGSVFSASLESDNSLKIKTLTHWQPPKESLSSDIDEYADRFKHIFKSAVADRCRDRRIAVTLSGGLDSRLILSTVPPDVDCLGLTFCDHVNREASIAYKAANAYKRQWLPLFRDKEYIARSMLQCVRFTGCECDWIHGHATALSRQILDLGVSTVLSGYLMDTFLRGYFAKDITRMRRLLGLLPATFRTREFAWPWICSNFCLEYVSRELIEQAFVRRKSYFDTHADTHRGSIVEWLDIYPFSQRPEIGTWTTERRKIPQRLVAMDRRLLDFSFACPAELRANGSVFMRAALDLLGPGASIPNANNGVRPCSSNLGRIYERGLRKFEDLKENIIKACGWPVVIQHSWHDYNRYWLESVLLKGLVLSYRPHLSSIEGLIFNEKVSPIESSYLLNWRDGFRLLALAVWKSNLAMYRRELDASPVSPLSSITIPAPSTPPLENNQNQSKPVPPGISPQPQLQPPRPD